MQWGARNKDSEYKSNFLQYNFPNVGNLEFITQVMQAELHTGDEGSLLAVERLCLICAIPEPQECWALLIKMCP